MFKIIFNYEGNNVTILSNSNDKIKKSIESLLNKINIESKNLYFLYNGKLLDTDLTINQISNSDDKNREEMFILVQDISNSTIKIRKPKTKEVICPTCKENIFLSIKNYKLNLHDCINKHVINNLSIIEYEKTQIKNTINKCDICKDENKENLNINKNYYKCLECKNIICQLCKEKHDNSHHLLNYEYKSFKCYKHNNSFFKYCQYCKIDLCKICEKEHLNHNIISFEQLVPKEFERIKQKSILKEKIEKFKLVINDFINQLNNVMNNIETYYKISNDLINNFEKEYNNYYVSYNLKELYNFNEIVIKDLDKIIKEKSFENIKKIYFKMNNKNSNMENNVQIKPIINRNSESNINNKYSNLFMSQNKTRNEKIIKITNLNPFTSTQKPENINKIFSKTISKKNTNYEINNKKSAILTPKNLFIETKTKRPLSSKKKVNNNIPNESNLNPNIITNSRNPSENLNIKRSYSLKKPFNKIKKETNVDDIYDNNFIVTYEKYYKSNDKEIISLQIGKAGMELGLSVWELFINEHGIQPDGVKPIVYNEDFYDNYIFKSFFNETIDNRFIPRCLFIDTEPNLINTIEKSAFPELFLRENFVFGLEESSKLYSCRYTPEGKDIINITLERIRHFLEFCDNPQGFLMFNSIGGGTGSGLGSLLLEEISNEYSKKNKFCFSIYPSIQNDLLNIQKMNSIFSISSSLKYSDMDFIFQNDAIKKILTTIYDLEKVYYIDINRFISQVISSITCPLRYNKNINMSDYIDWLIPFPKLHFLLSSYAPIIRPEILKFETINAYSITRDTFYKNSMFANCVEDYNIFISSFLIYKGVFNENEISYSINKIIEQKNLKFGKWCETGFKYLFNYDSPYAIPGGYFPHLSMSVCRISNIPGINTIFENFTKSYNESPKKSLIQKYLSEGMEEQEINQASEDLNDLVNEYGIKENEIINNSNDDDSN